MDRVRFDQLLDAYGAEFRRWPESERANGEAFARDNAIALTPLLADAARLDRALGLANTTPAINPDLSARILAAAPKQAVRVVRRSFAPAAGWALAACALLGALIGYGGAMFAPAADQDAYFAAAFEAPPSPDPGDQG